MILRQYFLKVLARCFISIFVIAFGLQFIFSVVAELSAVGHGHYHIWQALLVVLCETPVRVYALLPVILFLACIITLGQLSASQEMLVCRLGGLTAWGVARFVLYAAAMITLLFTVMGELFAPALHAYGSEYRQQLVQGSRGGAKTGGHWFRNQRYFVFVQAEETPTLLKGISWFYWHDKTNTLELAGQAASAMKDGDAWQCEDVTLFHHKQNGIQTERAITWRLPIQLDLLSWSRDKDSVQQLNLVSLWHYWHQRAKMGGNVWRLASAFWMRIFQPLMCLVLALLTVPFSIRFVRRLSSATRLVIGVAVGFLFYMIDQFLSAFSIVLMWSPFWVAVLPIACFAAFAAVKIQQEE